MKYMKKYNEYKKIKPSTDLTIDMLLNNDLYKEKKLENKDDVWEYNAILEEMTGLWLFLGDTYEKYAEVLSRLSQIEYSNGGYEEFSLKLIKVNGIPAVLYQEYKGECKNITILDNSILIIISEIVKIHNLLENDNKKTKDNEDQLAWLKQQYAIDDITKKIYRKH